MYNELIDLKPFKTSTFELREESGIIVGEMQIDNKLISQSSNIIEAYIPYYDILKNISGDVLLGGLGSGGLAMLLSEIDAVNSIQVIENNRDVIDCFLTQGYDNPKLEIIESDFFSHIGNYDYVINDTYPIRNKVATAQGELLYGSFEDWNLDFSDDVPNYNWIDGLFDHSTYDYRHDFISNMFSILNGKLNA